MLNKMAFESGSLLPACLCQLGILAWESNVVKALTMPYEVHNLSSAGLLSDQAMALHIMIVNK